MKLKTLVSALIFLITSHAYAAESFFSTSMRLYPPITITQTNSLTFQSVIAGSNIDIVTTPESQNAVVFHATGEPHAYVNASVIESEITLIKGIGDGKSEQIKVDSFTTGGDVTAGGIGSFDAEGKLENLRIGATAHVTAENLPGDYASSATFRLTYI